MSLSYPSYPLTIHQLFERQVEQTPETIALASAATVHTDAVFITYRQLNNRANQVAHYLLRRGVKPEERIGLLTSRSLEAVIGILGILKAGCAYVPLDPTYPTERLAYMVADAQIAMGLSQADLCEKWQDFDSELQIINLDSDWPLIASGSRHNPEINTTPQNLAYVIYTSGSSGRPKGVMIEHRSPISLLYALLQDVYQGITYVDWPLRISINASLSFDASVQQLVMLLEGGHTLYLIPQDARIDGQAFLQFIQKYPIDAFDCTPSQLKLFLEAGLLAISQQSLPSVVLVAGEAIDPVMWRTLALAQTQFFNIYGPTECTVDATAYPITNPEETPTIGRALEGYDVHILEPFMQPARPDMVAEIYIGGAGLARGYLDQPALTSQRFIPNPFSTNGDRVYKSGDLARYRADGNIEFEGRQDQQVKIRGFRIELGEIESALKRHPIVKETVVTVHAKENGDKQLVAHVVLDETAVTQEISKVYNERLAELQSVFDFYYLSSDEAYIGWNSSFTGLPFLPAENEEWSRHTIERIQALHPKRILEIGCGAGILLSSLAPHCERYVATDYSEVVLARLCQQLSEKKWPVELLSRQANDFTGLESQVFDTIVINSVTQYFPGVTYLYDVIEQACDHIAPGGTIFIGDVCNFSLLRAFKASLTLSKLPDETDIDHFYKEFLNNFYQEEELFIDPAFFLMLPKKMPAIFYVEIQLKRGKYLNELTKFRYDVLIHMLPGPDLMDGGHELVWDDNQSIKVIYTLLDKTKPDSLAVRKVPNSRLVPEMKILAGWKLAKTVGALRQIIEENEGATGVDPEAFWALATQLPYKVVVSWSQDSIGAYDVFFIKQGKTYFNKRSVVDSSPLTTYTNFPVKGEVLRQFIPKLRQFLQLSLAEYMVPALFYALDNLPLTPNGKLDTKSLPEPNRHLTAAALDKQVKTTNNPIEEIVATIWADLLNLEHVGAHDNFFEMGGHSLMGTRLATRLRTLFGVDLPLKKIFDLPTVAEISNYVSQLLKEETGVTVFPVKPRPLDIPVPLSLAQQRLWLENQLMPGSAQYNISIAVHITGHLHIDLLARSFSAVIQRHESLRTTFVSIDNLPRQNITNESSWELHIVDLHMLPQIIQQQETQRLYEADRNLPFDLSRGPLIRTTLLHIAKEENILLLTLHHIISDGWSMSILVRDIVAFYRSFLHEDAPQMPDLPIQYGDFAYWQHAQEANRALQMAYWQRQLNDIPSLLPLLTDRLRPPVQTSHSKTVSVEIDLPLLTALKMMSHQEGVTLFMIFLAALQILMARYSGQHNIVIGVPMAGRSHTEIEDLIGFFINVVPLSVNLTDTSSVREILQYVRKVTLAAYSHQTVSLEEMVKQLQPPRDLSHQPLFQVLFAYQNYPTPDMSFTGLHISPLETLNYGFQTMDLIVTVQDNLDDLSVDFSYSTDLFDADTIAQMVRHWQLILQWMSKGSEQNLAQLSLASHQFESLWSKNEEYQDQLLDLFEKQAQSHYDRIAIVDDGLQFSYGLCSRLANQLARLLNAEGLQSGMTVGIYLESTAASIISILAILKNGGICVPLVTGKSQGWISSILQNTQADLLFTQQALLKTVPNVEATTICWEELRLSQFSSAEIDFEPALIQDAIILFGTNPNKGMVYSYGSLRPRSRTLDISADSHLLLTIPHRDLFGLIHGLTTGATIYAPPHKTSNHTLTMLVNEQAISGLAMNARRLLQIPDNMLATAKTVTTIVTDPDLLDDSLREAYDNRFIHAYGLPFVWAASEASQALEKPLEGSGLYVLDQYFHPTAIGVPGNLYMSIQNSERRYLRLPRDTSLAFIPNPFSQIPGCLLFRSKYIACYQKNGDIKVLGTHDQVVVQRRYQLNLKEIESVIRKHPHVLDVVVVQQDEQIVAYYISEPTAFLGANDLREFLKERLPHFMRPSTLSALQTLPLSPLALPDIQIMPLSDNPSEARETENKLTQIREKRQQLHQRHKQLSPKLQALLEKRLRGEK